MISSERGSQRDIRRQLLRANSAHQTAEEMMAHGVGKTFKLSWETSEGQQEWTDIDPDAFNKGVNKIKQALEASLAVLPSITPQIRKNPFTRFMDDIKTVGRLLRSSLK